MADIFDPSESSSSPLLCDESKDLCFDDHDIDASAVGFIHDDNDHHHHFHKPLIDFPEQSDELFTSIFERETQYLPKDDYFKRLRCGDLDLSVRLEAFDWIFKAHSFYSFGPLTFCLAVNYLDRFLSTRELPIGKAWAVQLLSVACLSIAAKIEETSVPHSVEFQVGDPKFVFEAKTIQRMELLVLDTLKWKMNAVTPCSLLDYSLKKLCDAHNNTSYLSSSSTVFKRSMQLISCTIRGIDFLEFRPSEIAAAVAMCVTAEIQAVDIDKASSCFSFLEKGRVLKCMEMIKNNIVSNRMVPQSPNGVLEAGCFSYKSDELTSSIVFGSCLNSSQITTTKNPTNKRKKLDS
ncbi:cyclin-D4-1-like [Amaranthus tricolor]|uniref:cyclin-D4-1-like n=1 Tax=Amaranthus tricolor TaxID=29722 RepID=UPI0025886B9D|nr:cyclin-D4-1-like [Amaranthus tricolor]